VVGIKSMGQEYQKRILNIYDFLVKPAFYKYTFSKLKAFSIIVGIIGLVIGIFDFILICLTFKWRLYIFLIVLIITVIFINLVVYIRAIVYTRKAKLLIIDYLNSLIQLYDNQRKEFNLINRTIYLRSSKSLFNELNYFLNSDFIPVSNGLNFLLNAIESKFHIYIKGQMGIGKSILLLSLVNELARELLVNISKQNFRDENSIICEFK